MQLELKKKETFTDGIKSLLLLRSELFKIVETFFAELSAEDFSKMPEWQASRERANETPHVYTKILQTISVKVRD